MKPMSQTATLVALLAALLLSSCASSEGDPSGGATGRAADNPGAAKAPDGSWSVSLDATGSALVITIFGSSSCPSAATEASVRDGRVVVATERVGERDDEPCSADTAPYTSEVALPSGNLPSKSLAIELEGNPAIIAIRI